MRAAIFYLLINSYRLNKVNTGKYFTDILPRLKRAQYESIAELLPNRWTPLPKDDP